MQQIRLFLCLHIKLKIMFSCYLNDDVLSKMYLFKDMKIA